MASRTIKALKEQEAAFRRAQSEAFKASAKVVRIQKIVDNLKLKSAKELDKLIEEIEAENAFNDNKGGKSLGGAF